MIDKPVITNPYVEQFALHPTPVRLSSGEELVVPFRFWRTRALLLTGSADYQYMRQQLARHDETPIVDPNTGKALVHICWPHFCGICIRASPRQSLLRLRVQRRLTLSRW